MNIGRLNLTRSIHKKLGSIKFRKIYQAIKIIVEQITNDLVNDQVVTVRRFGTLSPHVRSAHLAHDINDGVVRKLKPRRSVKFHPHTAFSGLIKDRQERFLQNDDDKVLDEKRKL